MFQGKSALPSGRHSSVSAGFFTAFVLLFIVCTRWASAPRWLYYFDSANFAFSLERFNPALHQPQPPGYPLFVLLIRIIHFWVEAPERVMLIAGLVAAIGATLLIRQVASQMFGSAAGVLAAVLLASNPVFWFAGVTNQIRLFLAVSALSVSLAAWRALRDSDHPKWFYITCAALGVAAGFRPVCSVLLLPLVVWVWWRTGHSPRRLLMGAAIVLAVALPWVAAVVIASGGVDSTIAMLWGYATGQFQGSSAVFGAPAKSAWLMFKEALVWNLLGVVGWIWAVRFRPVRPERRDQALFLAIAFLPPFLFSAFIHIGDPDQALASISILCVAGGAVLAAGKRRLVPLACSVAAFQVLLFFVPPTKLAKASSYKTVVAVDRMNNGALSAIETLRRNGPVTIVHYGSSVASRHLAYYFPDDYVLILPANPEEGIQMYYRHEALPGRTAMTPHSRRVICLLPYQERAPTGWRKWGAVYYLDSDGPVSIGPYTLTK